MKRRLERFATALFAATSIFVVLVNLGVRELGGGGPNLLSPFFLREKCAALHGLLLHYVLHPFRPEEPEVKSLLASAADRHRLPRSFVLSIAKVESNLEAHRISRAGAMGLMQIMPATGESLGLDDPFDPSASADAGARHLKSLWIRYRGDRRRVAAAYNCGQGCVPAKGALDGLPAETRAYVKRVEKVERSLQRRS